MGGTWPLCLRVPSYRSFAGVTNSFHHADIGLVYDAKIIANIQLAERHPPQLGHAAFLSLAVIIVVTVA